MDIKDILDSLGLDFSNPEVRRGAMEAIDAILASRSPAPAGGGAGSGGGQDQEVEIDPDLIQPSIKQTSTVDDDDIEIEDEEDILGQVKHNDSEDPIENSNNASGDDESDSNSQESDSQADDESEAEAESESGEGASDNDEASDSEYTDNDEQSYDEDDNDQELEDGSEVNDSEDDDNEAEGDFDDAAAEEAELADDAEEENEVDTDEDEVDGEPGDESEYDQEDADDASDDEFDFDEDDLVDDELDSSAEDEKEKTKREARKIKRDRTIAAAQKALADAKARKVAPSLIRELENAIAALEALTEAVAKNIKDISDAEFNQLVNRVFDAIQACGDTDLTFTSEEERAAQVKEIKDDISKVETQNELSAEDIAKIRAETQAIKAREKEIAKYAPRASGSFKGFQDFLTSLYRAIALQVSSEETRDDSWSALSRRNSGAGVLQQGKKINELSNKKIPIIDFYFDCSSSWTADDIKVGKKAVAALADMEEKGQIKVNLYYFGDDVSTEYEEVAGQSTSGWNEIVKNVIATQATNVVVMTDSDMQSWWTGKKALTYTVPGYVWYLWKNGKNAPRLPRDLKGRGGVQQFSFSAADV